MPTWKRMKMLWTLDKILSDSYLLFLESDQRSREICLHSIHFTLNDCAQCVLTMHPTVALPNYQRPSVQVPQPLKFAENAYDAKIGVESMLYHAQD